MESIHWSAVGCDLLTAVHIFGNSPDVSRKVCLSSGLDRGPRDCVCPLVLELRADLRFVTVFYDWYFNECVSCVSTRFRVHIPDCVREVVSDSHFF